VRRVAEVVESGSTCAWLFFSACTSPSQIACDCVDTSLAWMSFWIAFSRSAIG
jgi:hypothetical protein